MSNHALDGLTTAEVEDRRARGLDNDVPDAPSRTIPEILRANLLTRFNFLMAVLVAIVVAAGSPGDALFGGVIIANSLVGIIQELRAKRLLDQLAVLSAPIAHVVRDGKVTDLAVSELVLDDVIELSPGQQVVADAEMLTAEGIEVDESLLTGESDPVVKQIGSELMSGSFVVTGSGRAVVTKVGADGYAARLAEQARRFTLSNSELRKSIDQIVTWVSWALIPAAIGLLWSQLRQHHGIREAMVSVVAGLVGMVPEGLVLLTSVAFAVGVVRLARRRTLVQELPAVETLARVNVICLDKTGTITKGTLAVDSVVPLDDVLQPEEIDRALTAIAWSDPFPNPTQQALADEYPTGSSPWSMTNSVPFSSARKWSASEFQDRGWWILGAPEMVLADRFAEVSATVQKYAGAGLRVLLLAHSAAPPNGDTPPGDTRATALVLLTDSIREDAPETLQYFAEQGVNIKVISGDNPSTVGAVAQRAGVPNAEALIDARELPTDESELEDAMERHTVFGRVTPLQKQAMVSALQRRGNTVAMTGDGVNDVLALKNSDCGIAMASGSEATRSVAQLVLLDSNFSGLPAVVNEGRRVINNLQRVASLFLTKTTYAVIFAFVTGLTGVDYPFLPRHLTLISTMCIGVPSFFLALAPNNDRIKGSFLRTVMRDSVPVGAVTAIATMAVFMIARSEHGVSLTQQRTAATMTLAGCSLLLLLRNARPLKGWKLALVTAMGAGVFAAFALPFGRRMFEFKLPPVEIMPVAAIGVGAAAVAMIIADRVIPTERHDHHT
jgi:cation-transporting ATPase E